VASGCFHAGADFFLRPRQRAFDRSVGLAFGIDRYLEAVNPRAVTESEGCALLLAKFTAAGYAIKADFHFHEGEIEVDLDGWDDKARVGYEYITREAQDDRQFDAATLARFEARMEKGELFVLLVDEREAVTEKALSEAANGFLTELSKKRGGKR
jgi:hypothetical protein